MNSMLLPLRPFDFARLHALVPSVVVVEIDTCCVEVQQTHAEGMAGIARPPPMQVIDRGNARFNLAGEIATAKP